MGLRSLLTGGKTATPTPTGRTPKDRRRDSDNVRKIDAGTDKWLKAGGRGPRKGNR